MKYNYTLHKFKVEDWDEIDAREELVPTLNEVKQEAIFKDSYTKGMPIFTMRANGKIIVIYGFMYGGCGTYMPVAILSKDAEKHKFKIIKSFFEYFATFVPATCRRMEGYCDIMDVKANRMIKVFGFSPIGIRHNSTPEGHDQVIYERLTYFDKRKTKIDKYGRNCNIIRI